MKMLKLTLLNGETFYMNPLRILTVCEDAPKGAVIYAGSTEEYAWRVKEEAHEVAGMWEDVIKG